jgi:acetyl esterase
MPLDPQIEQILQQSSSWAPARSVPVDQLRAAVKGFAAVTPKLPVRLRDVTDRSIPASQGEVPVRIYTPEANGPRPLLVYFHGGGWVVGDLDTQDMICRGLCHGANCIVVSVDYRLAPEHRFPAAVDDCYAVLEWCAAHGREIGGHPDRLAVGGDSAGAVLSAAVALRARDEGGPQLRAQLLYYGSMNYPSGNLPSMAEFADGPILTADDVDYFWHQYLAAPETDQNHPWASPIRAANHAGLPPAFIGTAEMDPTRDPAEAYGPVLTAAGVPVELRRYAGMPHGFMSWLGFVDTAQTACDDACAWLRRQFEAPR